MQLGIGNTYENVMLIIYKAIRRVKLLVKQLRLFVQGKLCLKIWNSQESKSMQSIFIILWALRKLIIRKRY